MDLSAPAGRTCRADDAREHRNPPPVARGHRVLAIIAFHHRWTRAEIEEIRGVITSKGTLDVLLETGWDPSRAAAARRRAVR